jgi:hypothetical protein
MDGHDSRESLGYLDEEEEGVCTILQFQVSQNVDETFE